MKQKSDDLANIMLKIALIGQKEVWQSIEKEKDAWKRIEKRKLFTIALKELDK